MEMDNCVYIDIRVKRHIKLYLEKNLFLTKPYQLSSTDPFGIVIHNYIQGKRDGEFPSEEMEGDLFRINLGYKTSVNTRIYIGPDGIKRFSGFVEKMMLYEFCRTTVLAVDVAKMEVREAIYHFQDKYDLDDTEMNYERLEKAYYRYRARLRSHQQQEMAEYYFPKLSDNQKNEKYTRLN